MTGKKNIFAITGSAGADSANLKLLEQIAGLTKDVFHVTIFNNLKTLPHFDPELSAGDPPKPIVEFRNAIEKSDGILICTPEYVFSLPSGLKNALEWCVATTLFSEKPCGLITASASGQKGHEELQLVMKTLMAKFTDETTLLIQGIKGKFDERKRLSDKETTRRVNDFIEAFKNLVIDKEKIWI
ncbi:MAG: NADPH-dependent FMN reductase [Bacteroidia bacterium]